MKAGILTYHDADNYGAVLQAYALQQSLKKLACGSELIAFNYAPVKEGSSPLIRKMQQKALERHARFDDFRHRHLSISQRYDMDNPAGLNDSYAFFICGSDQVWNPLLPDFHMNYFLSFASPAKRYSYAASFGADSFPDAYAAQAKELLSGFQAISFREKSALPLVRELAGCEASVNLDPVLLLKREDWNPIIPEGEDNCVFLYQLAHDSDMEANALQYAEEHGKKLKVVTGFALSRFGFEAYSGYGPCDWLSAIAHADAVFTNSFHGAAFALLYGRPLYLSALQGNLAARNTRLFNLLELAGLSYPGAAAPIMCGAPEFAEAIRTARDESIAYLNRIVRAHSDNQEVRG